MMEGVNNIIMNTFEHLKYIYNDVAIAVVKKHSFCHDLKTVRIKMESVT